LFGGFYAACHPPIRGLLLSLVIFRFDELIAELRPIVSQKHLRPFGLCAGEFTVPDDFDAPLPEDRLDAFEGK
jgi:hypothetical protein